MAPEVRMFLLFLCVRLFSCVQTQRVCMGTTKGLQTWTSDIRFKEIKERYSGCEIVEGNLEITDIDHNRDISFLQSIREVTGYVLVALNEFSRLPLDQLRLIRGNSLYEEKYALAILLNSQREGDHGLQELGLTHLTEILEGGVNIALNKYLSYATNVNWLDIVKNGSACIKIENNGPDKPCDKACGEGACWGPESDQCQILTKTVCAPECSGRCSGRSLSECCHNECAGGCTGPLDTDCFACQRFNNSGSCVHECPPALLYNNNTFTMEANPNAMYQLGSICVTQCPTNLVVDGSSCALTCPPDTVEVDINGEKRCQPCTELCPKACYGTGTGQSVDANNIDSFINCTKIQGSLQFLVTGIEGDHFNKVPPLDPDKLNIFDTVREITDILSIHSWPESMSDLSVFSNLETIGGRSLNQQIRRTNKRRYSLLVLSIPTLTSLGLRSLKRINDGSVYIRWNKKLCYHHTMNWTKIFSSNNANRGQMQKYISDNYPKEKCVAEGHVCDPLCSDGCWGPGPDQCVSCQNYNRGGTCVSDCMFLSGERREFASSSGECLPCHSECKVQEGQETCFGQGADQCVSCANYQDGAHCVPSCPQGLMTGEDVIFKYPNKAGICEVCHSNCTQGCSGPGLQDCIGMAGIYSTP